MLKMAARVYLADWKGIRTRGNRVQGVLWGFYCLVMIPLMFGYFESQERAVGYMSVVIPFGYCIAQSGLCPLRMPEILFLCPMDEAMRRSYIRCACRFRVGLHTMLGAVGALITLFLGNDIFGALGPVINVCLISIIGILVEDERGAAGRIATRCVGMGLGTLLQIIYADVAAVGILRQARWEQVVIAVMQVLFVLLAVRYLVYWRDMQEEVIRYERIRSQRA